MIDNYENELFKKYSIEQEIEEVDDSEIRIRVKNQGSVFTTTISKKSHWQEAHYHKNTKEIYLVEKGRILLYTIKKSKKKIIALLPESMVIIKQNIPHKIYMEEGSIIHTSKQVSIDQDRYISNELDSLIKNENMDINNYLSESSRKKKVITVPCDILEDNEYAEYSEGYRHFDQLIWQLPTWNVVVFAGVLSAYNYIINECKSVLGLDARIMSSSLLICAILFFYVGYYSLYRWRVHQRYTKKANVPRAPKILSKLFGGQFMLQLVSGLEVCVFIILFIIQYISNVKYIIEIVVSTIILMMLISLFIEYKLRRHPNRQLIEFKREV